MLRERGKEKKKKGSFFFNSPSFVFEEGGGGKCSNDEMRAIVEYSIHKTAILRRLFCLRSLYASKWCLLPTVTPLLPKLPFIVSIVLSSMPFALFFFFQPLLLISG